MVARHPGTVGVVVKHLASGESASVNADQRFRSASLYKLFILAAAYQRMEAGLLSPDEVLTLTPALAEANPYADLPVGAQTTAHCALRTMVEMSGNAAADLLETRLGLPAINAQIQALGLEQSELTDNWARTSPADMARLLELIWRGEAVSPAASAHMLELLQRQQHVDLLPAPLPLGVQVANKTGQLPGLRHDVGIVYAPSGPYLFVAMVQDAPGDAAARSTIHDLSRTVYTTIEPAGVPTYRGLPPRLAREVFRTADDQGRLALLADPRTETVSIAPLGIALTHDAGEVRLRPQATEDLLSLQRAADQAGSPFWVSAGYRRPTDADATKALPVAWHLPCAVEFPSDPAPDPGPFAGPPSPNAQARQHWLGTVVAVSGTPEGEQVDGANGVEQWLRSHAWAYGFVPALPETSVAETQGREPGALRWVGREMAAHLRPLVGSPEYGARVTEELRRAERELAAQGARTPFLPTTACWAEPGATTRGCPARWYFLPF